jgi:hypothetical protein
MEIWAALAIGFMGSFHCIGMCGPIALALPGSQDANRLRLIWGRILYNLGRVFTYAVLGAIFGLIGRSVALAGFQQSVSIVLGAAIILSVFFRSEKLRSVKEALRADFFFDRIKSAISSRFRKQGVNTLFTIGLLNGLLPCGFVYVGLAGSVTTGSVLNGTLFMILFGLGTVPVMFFMAMAPGMISISLRNKINKVIPVLAIAFGAYLIYHGIMFGQMMHAGH